MRLKLPQRNIDEKHEKQQDKDRTQRKMVAGDPCVLEEIVVVRRDRAEQSDKKQPNENRAESDGVAIRGHSGEFLLSRLYVVGMVVNISTPKKLPLDCQIQRLNRDLAIPIEQDCGRLNMIISIDMTRQSCYTVP